MTQRPAPLARLRAAAALLGISVTLGACNIADHAVTGTVPDDYRQRHPIAVREGEHSIVVFVGHARPALTPQQRADVAGLAHEWMKEGTGAVIADVPVGTANARAAAGVYRDIRNVLSFNGVPSRAIVLHQYNPEDSALLPTIRLSYSRMTAVAGPCGVWPEDLGPSIFDPAYNENKPYYNFGCATQRNLAAMVANPSDLVQPRSETPAYTARRTEGFEKYRQGNSTSTTYPEAEKAKLSDIGK